MKLSEKIEISLVRSGQPQAYADNETVYQVKFAYFNYVLKDGEWSYTETFYPEWLEKTLSDKALYLTGASKYDTRENVEWHESYLDYVKKISPGVYEVRLVEPYID